MIERYSRPEMSEIWSEEGKYRRWLEVELAVYRTMPHRLSLSRSNVKVPMAVLVGKQTDTH